MARRKTRTLTELELAIMQIVWKDKEVTVEDIRRQLKKIGRPLALPSIRTMLGILMDKGYVARRPIGRGHAYRAVVTADKAKKHILKDVVERAFDGSAMNLVSALVDSKIVSKKELTKVKRLIKEYEEGMKK